MLLELIRSSQALEQHCLIKLFIDFLFIQSDLSTTAIISSPSISNWLKSNFSILGTKVSKVEIFRVTLMNAFLSISFLLMTPLKVCNFWVFEHVRNLQIISMNCVKRQDLKDFSRYSTRFRKTAGYARNSCADDLLATQ